MLINSEDVQVKLEASKQQVDILPDSEEVIFNKGYNAGLLRAAYIVQEFVNSLSMQMKPFVFLSDMDTAVVLYCTEELYQQILDLDRITDDSNLDPIKLFKMYKSFKSVLKKGFKK